MDNIAWNHQLSHVILGYAIYCFNTLFEEKEETNLPSCYDKLLLYKF